MSIRGGMEIAHNSYLDNPPVSSSSTDARPPEQYPYYYSSRGTVYYTPRTTTADRRPRRIAVTSPSLPAPHIGPRQRRPHSIHIVSYPSGYIPHDLRPKPTSRDLRRQRRKEEEKQRKREEEDKKKEEGRQRRQREQERRRRRAQEQQDKRRSFASSLSGGDKRVGTLLNKFKAAFSFSEAEPQRPAAAPDAVTTPGPTRTQPRARVRPVSWLGVTSRLSRVEDSLEAEQVSLSPVSSLRRPTTAPQLSNRRHTAALPCAPDLTSTPSLAEQQHPASPPSPGSSSRPEISSRLAPVAPVRTPLDAAMVDISLRGPNLAHGSGFGTANTQRNSFMSVRSANKSVVSSSVQEIQQPKPTASASGLCCTILLAEPNVFLTGFDHDGHTRQESHNSTALLRGKLQLNVSKNTKIKSVTLKLLGKARTEWPEGIPPLKVDMYEEESLRTQALTFFHAMHDGWETEFGNQCSYTLRGSNNPNSNLIRPSLSPEDSGSSLGSRPRSNLSAKELKKLSLRSVESRSFGKGDSPAASQVHAKGFKVFYPGTYEYSFELPIDHHQLETIKLQYGSVKWELETTVERAGAFKPNLHGTKEVSIVRVPDQMSLETSEPISISRQWEDQLHYDIMISGKSFPIGAKIPIAFKLTPLAKVQVHKLKVFVTESIEYWTNDRKVTRRDPGRKILLLEKTAGKAIDKQFASSELRILSGGELSPDQRFQARESAARRRTLDAQRTGTLAQPLPEPSENLLGDLDLGLETYWASTEMEMNVQMPTCEMMAKDKSLRMHPDCSWKNVNVYHWMKIVMRISRLDPEDPAGKRRRHFEISIDSPFTVLNCRATQANTALPQYDSPEATGDFRRQTSCGCPDAHVLSTSGGGNGGGTPENTSATQLDSVTLPAPPRAAHLHTASQGINGNSASASPTMTTAGGLNSTPPTSANPLQRVRDQDASARPIHLIRYPSFDPPPFNADNPPPPMPTPPPNYDIVVGTPSVDGMAGYFERLLLYECPNQQEQDEQTGSNYFATGADGPGGEASAPQRAHASGGSDDDGDTEVESDSDSADERGPARTVSRAGTVNIANPRTPGGRLVPSRSFEITRPGTSSNFTLDMSGVIRRGGAGTADAGRSRA